MSWIFHKITSPQHIAYVCKWIFPQCNAYECYAPHHSFQGRIWGASYYGNIRCFPRDKRCIVLRQYTMLYRYGRGYVRRHPHMHMTWYDMIITNHINPSSKEHQHAHDISTSTTCYFHVPHYNIKQDFHMATSRLSTYQWISTCYHLHN